MLDSKRVQETINLIEELRSQLAELASEVLESRDTDTGFEPLRRWKERAARKLSEEISPSEGKKLAAKRKMSFRMVDSVGDLIDEDQMYDGFLIALGQEVYEHP